MPDTQHSGANASADLVRYTHWIYGLHTLAVIIGFFGSGSITGKFAFSAPSFIAVVMNYARREESTGTWVESHFVWKIRTYWFAWFWIIIATLFAMPLAVLGAGWLFRSPIFVFVSIWITYRVWRGWTALQRGQLVP